MSLRQARTLSRPDAARVVEACLAHAALIGVSVCVAVTDNAGHLLHFTRMDGAPLLSISIAQDKAYSVAAFNGMPTDAWWGLISQDDALVHGVVKTKRLVVFGGGQPCSVGGELVGAVGVSGGTVEQDVAIARAGVLAL